jgi:hypothetical protein
MTYRMTTETVKIQHATIDRLLKNDADECHNFEGKSTRNSLASEFSVYEGNAKTVNFTIVMHYPSFSICSPKRCDPSVDTEECLLWGQAGDRKTGSGRQASDPPGLLGILVSRRMCCGVGSKSFGVSVRRQSSEEMERYKKELLNVPPC